MRGFFILALLCTFLIGSAQYENLMFKDYIYVPNIKTVQINLIGLPNSQAIYQLGSPAALELNFDDLEDNVRFYTYQIIHCDMFWNPTGMMYHEYATGFENEEILDYSFSVTTRINFSNYSLKIPNQNTTLTKSGNYLIVVHAEGDLDRPMLSRRFVVLDPPVISIRIVKVRPSNVLKMNTHQEMRFDIDTKELYVKDPKREIMAVVLQNGRWDNALMNIRSRFEKGPLLVFDYLDKTLFPAGKEFRSIDIRSTAYRGEGVFALELVDGHMRQIIRIDKSRGTLPYFSKTDVNGQFVVSSTDYPDPADFNLRADYVETVFTLETPEYDRDVYVFGGLTDWDLKEEFKLRTIPEYQGYSTTAWLKQGYYDYIYVLANEDGTIDEVTLEGNWYESTNDYTLIVYYRPFGSLYDRAIGATTYEWGR